MLLGAVLYVYKGEWGLPSIDFECLRTLCAVKFTRAPIEICTSGNPLWSGDGSLPYLRIGKQKIVGYRKIQNFLDSEGFSLNSFLTPEDTFLSAAYNNLVFQRMHGYYYYHMYGQPINFEITRTLYAKRTPFPFNFYYPGKYFRCTEHIVETFANFKIYDKIEDHDSSKIFLEAKWCVDLLSKKLNNKIWFFGDVFSEFDAIVYSYLSLLFHIILPHNPIQIHIQERKNLVNFINRITKDIFREDGFNSKLKVKNYSQEKNAILLTNSEKKNLATKKATQCFAAMCAALAMTTYAALNGLLKFTLNENFEEQQSIDNDIASED